MLDTGMYKDHSRLVQSLPVSGAAKKPGQLNLRVLDTRAIVSSCKACSATGRGQFASTNSICTSKCSTGKGRSETQLGMPLLPPPTLAACLSASLPLKNQALTHPTERTNDVRIKWGTKEPSGNKGLMEVTDLLRAELTHFHVIPSISTYGMRSTERWVGSGETLASSGLCAHGLQPWMCTCIIQDC